MIKAKVAHIHSSGWLAVPLRWGIGFLFAYAGVVKIPHPGAFALAIYNYKLLPGWAIHPLAFGLPWIELVVGLSLLVGIGVRHGALLATILLGIFVGALGINVVRGLDVACGCFRISAEAGQTANHTPLYFVRDIVLLGIALYVLTFDRARLAVESLFRVTRT
jgi:uncharacterized membrane protein YphA (DoxX/SURF4 family)